VTIDHFAWPDGTAKPEISGIALLGSSNPGFLVNPAQLSMPKLHDMQLGATANRSHCRKARCRPRWPAISMCTRR